MKGTLSLNFIKNSNGKDKILSYKYHELHVFILRKFFNVLCFDVYTLYCVYNIKTFHKDINVIKVNRKIGKN